MTSIQPGVSVGISAWALGSAPTFPLLRSMLLEFHRIGKSCAEIAAPRIALDEPAGAYLVVRRSASATAGLTRQDGRGDVRCSQSISFRAASDLLTPLFQEKCP